ncbi:DUF4333 domain-containing protein [Plantibacter sp. MPB07]|uniref:DUF4333 domain-containing protein n=1 Tax=Plantibacter sp. MPB07 TaxID=3388853 RepID=UPI003987E75F
MTDDQKPEDLGKPPVGGPLRPDQQPPGFPDPNAPRLEFGPGSPQRQTPPQNGAPQNGAPQGQNGPPQGVPSQNGPSQPPAPGQTGGGPRPQGGAPGQQPNGPAPQPPAQSGAPFAGAPGGQPWVQQQRPSNAAPNQQPQQQGRPGGPDGFRPPTSNGQPGHASGGPQQGRAPSQAPHGRPLGAPQSQPQSQPQGPQGQPPYGQARPTGSQPFGPGQAQHPNGPFQPGPQQQGSQSGPQQTGPFRPGPEYGVAGQQPAASRKPARKPLGRKLWIGVLIGAVAASLIAVPLTLLSVGRLFTPMLDRGSVQTGVAEVLKQDFGLADVEKVECPSDQPATTGTQFECTFSYNAKSYPVAVEVINDQGQYRVGIDAPK